MADSRRNFLKKVSTLALTSLALPTAFVRAAEAVSPLPALKAAEEETFWEQVRQHFTVSPSLINLNNGGVSPQPKVVQNALIRNLEFSNEAPSFYMWRVLDKNREALRRNLAELAGCSADEIALNRNATEGLETVIFGLRLQKGDEVVAAKQDYPAMVAAWKQRELRDGIRVNWVDLPLPLSSDEEILRFYTEKITKKTKAVLFTHLINWTGQILPVKKLAEAARAINPEIEIIIDGAHSFAHLNFTIPELGGDYFGTSLHKWLCAPFGTGLLYVRKEKIAKLWPNMASLEPESEDIRKFEHLGTRSLPSEHAIGQALHFHYLIGPERKQARLHFLKKYWSDKVKHHPKIKFTVPLDEKYSCGLASFTIEGKTVNEVTNFLYQNYHIHAGGMHWENLQVVRITPHVYTTLRELDVLVEGVLACADGG